MRISRRSIFLEIIIGILVVYFSILILLFIFQRNLMYHPNENNYYGEKLEVEIEKVKIRTSDNINLLGWFHKKNLENNKTILFFHGNAGNLENRINKLNHFNDLNVNFLIIAWRGFSGNDGNPTENNLYIDGKSALEWPSKAIASTPSIMLSSALRIRDEDEKAALWDAAKMPSVDFLALSG